MWVIGVLIASAVLGDLSCEVILAMPYIEISLLVRTATGQNSICE